MKKKKLINCLSKKFIIKGVATILVALLPFSFVKPKKVEAIVVVDDAILFSVLGLGAVTSIGAVYGMSKNGMLEKTGNFLGNSLQEIGNDWKTINNSLAFAKSTVAMLPNILQAFENLEGTEYEEYLTPTEEYYYIPNTIGNYYFYWLGGTLSLPYPSTNVNEGLTEISINNNSVIVLQNNISLTSSDKTFVDFPLKVDKSKVEYFYTLSDFPTLNEVSNEPISISLDKSFVDNVATTYAEQNPNDNNGDKNVDYSTLIPLFFSMLEERLGDGTITPTNLSDNGVTSYVYKDGSVQGQNPYDFSKQDNSNSINVEQNITINNGSEISEEERNGILNILDNGVRKTTTLLSNLKNSMIGLGDTLQGLFSFLPEPVGYLFYSALCLSLIFFILSLRR